MKMAVPTPWSSLPPGLGDQVRPFLVDVVDEVIASIPSEVPSYGRPLEGRFGQGVRTGVEVALGRFLDLPGTDSPALAPEDRDVYLALGRGELLQGRSLEALLAAYRVGARVAFRRFADAAGRIDPGLLMPLAESVFAYIDELSAVSAEGYAAEQSRRAGESDRLRADLMTLLLSARRTRRPSPPQLPPPAGPYRTSWWRWSSRRSSGAGCAPGSGRMRS
jgi:hypothetical protein